MKNLLCALTMATLWGCAGRMPVIYEPIENTEVTRIYSNGVPLASSSVDGLFFLLSMDQITLAGEKYFRVWFLCKNISDSTMLLEPLKQFTLSIDKKTSGEKLVQKIIPRSPALILKKIKNEEATHTILAGLGGALREVSVKNTAIRSNYGETYEINNASEKREVIRDKTYSSMAAISNWYSIFQSSISSGILRKNTLFKEQSVNGYIYFPIADTDYSKTVRTNNQNKYDYTLMVHKNGIAKTIEFTFSEAE